MTTNPKRLSWTAPTERVDGTPIEGELTYTLYVDGTSTASFPGTLNPEGHYEILFADMAWEPIPGLVHTLALTATEDGRESARSSTVEVRFVGKPKEPVGLNAS